MKTEKETQHSRIAKYLATHSWITPMDAYQDLGITKLATRISEMKRKGYVFNQKTVAVTNRYGETVNVMAYQYVCFRRVQE